MGKIELHKNEKYGGKNSYIAVCKYTYEGELPKDSKFSICVFTNYDKDYELPVVCYR